MRLAFRRLSPAASAPERARDGDAGWDLRAAEEATVEPGARASIGIGIAIAVPAGHAGLVLPRSGLALRHGIALVNAPGLIDPGYRGEVRVLLLNTDAAASFQVQVGDRVAQLLLVRFEPIEPDEHDALPDSERGVEGFGSTGV